MSEQINAGSVPVKSAELRQQAVDFLFDWPGDRIHLVAIHPDTGKVIGRTFNKADSNSRVELAGWLAAANTKRSFGVYANYNGLGVTIGPNKTKAKEVEVDTLYGFHVDADVPKKITDPAEFEIAKAELLDSIMNAESAPNVIINSGNGFGLFWVLNEPVTVTDENRQHLRGINVALAQKFGGDNCHNLDRVMRVPFLINYPNLVKRQRGRKPVLATVICDYRVFVQYSLEDFDSLPLSNQQPVTADNIDIPDTVDLSGLDPDFRETLVTGAKPGTQYGDGSRSAFTYAMAAELRRAGFSDGEIVSVITNPDYAVSEHVLAQKQRTPDAQAARVIASLDKDGVALGGTAQEEFAADPVAPLTPEQEAEQTTIREKNAAGTGIKRPQVRVRQSYLPDAANAVERILLAEAETNDNPPDRIFQRDGRLVRLNRNLLPPDVKHDKQYRENNALTIFDVTAKWLADRLDRSIQFVGASAGKPGEKPKLVPKNAPPELVARMIDSNTHWQHPHLFGTIEAPTLREDGTVLDSPGFDNETGLYFDPNSTAFPKVKENPTKADGLAAIQTIESLLVDFPFQDVAGEEYDGVSKSVALAAILTSVVRRTLDIAPAFAISANEAESGKTELCKVIVGIQTGRAVPQQPLSESEDERRKSIGAALRESRPCLLFDNADNTPIEGDFLESIITYPQVSDRILAMTQSYTAPTNTLILFNGNKIEIAGAMTTRVLMCRIHPTKALRDRDFKYPRLFEDHIIKRRAELVVAALTALRAWTLADVTLEGRRQTDRFPMWDRMIAQALVWYGYADPVRGGDEIREIDPKKEAQRNVIRSIADAFSDETKTASDLYKHAEIRRAIADARMMKDRDVTTVHVGKYMSGLEGLRLDMDWQVRRMKAVRGEPATWCLEWTGNEEDRPTRELQSSDASIAPTDEDLFGG